MGRYFRKLWTAATTLSGLALIIAIVLSSCAQAPRPQTATSQVKGDAIHGSENQGDAFPRPGA